MFSQIAFRNFSSVKPPQGTLNISNTGNILSSLTNRGVISVRGQHATDLL